MTALAAARDAKEILPPNRFYDPVAANVKIYKGAICGIDSSGNLRPMVKAVTLTVRGVATETVDNTGGSAGDVSAETKAGTFEFQNDSTHPVTVAVKGQVVYGEDDQTVAINNTGSRNRVGRFHSLDSVNNKVRVTIGFDQAEAGLVASNNLSDVGAAATARANIGADRQTLSLVVPVDAAGVFYVPVPYGFTVEELRSCVEGATLANGSPTITAAIGDNGGGFTNVTGGVLTLADTSVVGTLDTASPSAANTGSADEIIRLTVAANSQDAANSAARVTIELSR